MKVIKLSLGPLGTNCYIVQLDNHALIFDPGGEAEKIISYLDENQIKPLAILLTHAHFDHIGAVDELRNKYEIDVHGHEKEADWLEDPNLNRSNNFIGQEIVTNKPEVFLGEGDFNIDRFNFEVIHTPGHSPGSISFIFHEKQFIISGDVLFLQGIGRTDLPGGNFEVIKESIQQKLYKLPDNYVILPGHGEQTSIGYEKKNNLYVPE
ncbi:MAG TPA: MBL fold metallo-hydrolase [Bacillota bacterium]|nr:MBL fold metallo-hydrolase [Bacillota bacterium]